MKPSVAWLLAATVFLPACPGGGGGSGTREAVLLVPRADTVNVSVSCSTPSALVHAIVAPWRQQVDSGHVALWKLTGTGATDLQITPHDTTTWPFENKAPSGTSSQEASSGPMTANPVRNQAIPYTLTVLCGDSLRVTIDPELIIPTT